MSRIYTEEQVKKAIALGYDWCHQKHIPVDFMIDNFINSLTPIQLPTDEEIKEEVSKLKFSKEGYRGGVIEGMIWMRDKIKGGQDNE